VQITDRVQIDCMFIPKGLFRYAEGCRDQSQELSFVFIVRQRLL